MEYWQELIPDGFDIHHKDHNHENDDPLNLELMTHSGHSKYHETGKTRSEETKRKMSESMKGQIPWNAGISPSEETRQRQSDSHKGKTPWNKGLTGIYSEETLEKISAAGKGRTRSEETKRKMSISQTGLITSEETKKKLSLANIGKHDMTDESKQKLSTLYSGNIRCTDLNGTNRMIQPPLPEGWTMGWRANTSE